MSQEIEIDVEKLERGLPRKGATTDDLLREGRRRTMHLLEVTKGCFTLAKKEDKVRIRFEALDGRFENMTPLEYRAFADAARRINMGLDEGFLALTPGVHSLEFLDVPLAVNALYPGFYQPKLLATIAGQWIPPGLTIDLTVGETDGLIAALATGSAAAWVAAELGFLPSGLVAAILALDAAGLALVKAASTTGAIGFKVTGLPPLVPIVVPYPI